MVEVETEVRIERTKDVALIRSIITHPKIYPHVADDFSPPPEQYDPSEAVALGNVYYLVAYSDEIAGLFSAYQLGGVMYQSHVAMLPHAYGCIAKNAAREFFAWMFANTICEKVIGLIPADNKRALSYARRVGMNLEGMLTRACRRNGSLIDVAIFGVSKWQKR